MVEELKNEVEEHDFAGCADCTEIVFLNLMDVEIKFCLSAFNL